MTIAMSKQFQYVIGCTTCKKTKTFAISNPFANGYQICNFITNVHKLTCLLHSNFANELELLPHLAYKHGIPKISNTHLSFICFSIDMWRGCM